MNVHVTARKRVIIHILPNKNTLKTQRVVKWRVLGPGIECLLLGTCRLDCVGRKEFLIPKGIR